MTKFQDPYLNVSSKPHDITRPVPAEAKCGNCGRTMSSPDFPVCDDCYLKQRVWPPRR